MLSTHLSSTMVPALSSSTPESLPIAAAVFMGAAEGDLLEGGNDPASSLPTFVAVMDPAITLRVMSVTLLSTDQFAAWKLISHVSLHTGIKRSIWTPQRYVKSQEDNMCKDMPQEFLLNGVVLKNTQMILGVAKSPWPPPPSN